MYVNPVVEAISGTRRFLFCRVGSMLDMSNIGGTKRRDDGTYSGETGLKGDDPLYEGVEG